MSSVFIRLSPTHGLLSSDAFLVGLSVLADSTSLSRAFVTLSRKSSYSSVSTPGKGMGRLEEGNINMRKSNNISRFNSFPVQDKSPL